MGFQDSDGNRNGFSASPVGALSTTPAVNILAGDVWTCLIDTNSNTEDYGLNLTAPTTGTITITSDGSASKPEIAGALATAWNANATCARYAVAYHPASANYLLLFPLTAGVTIAEDENAAKMTLTHDTVDASAEPVPGVFQGWTLRCKLTGASTFVPGDDPDGIVTVFLAADAAGDIPLTAPLEVQSAIGGTTATAGGFAASLDGMRFGAHASREVGRVYVVAKCATGTVNAQWFLDWTDVYDRGAAA